MLVYNGKWIYVMNGKFNIAYTGIAKNEYGKWYMQNGVLDRTFSGKVVIGEVTYNIVNGKVK